MNAPALVVLVLIGISLQTSLFSSYPLLYLQPDVVLLAVIWCALRRDFTEGGVLTLIFAGIAEIHSGAPKGLFLSAYMAIYLTIKGMSKVLVIPGLSVLVGLTLFASIVWKLVILWILYLMDAAENQWRHTLALLLPGAVMEGIVGTWVYRWLDQFDWKTFKNPRARAAVEEGLQLDEEGL